MVLWGENNNTFVQLHSSLTTGSRSSGSNPSAGKGRRPSPREKDLKAPCCGGSESEMAAWVIRRSEKAPSQLSHQSHSRSAASQAHSSHSYIHSGYSHGQCHSISQHSHNFTYSHAPFIQSNHLSCVHSERSHGSSYGPPGLPPPYCLAHLALKAAASNSPPGAPPIRELGNVPPELTASRQSFQHAMGNPCEFFVDIMWQESAFNLFRAQGLVPTVCLIHFCYWRSLHWECTIWQRFKAFKGTVHPIMEVLSLAHLSSLNVEQNITVVIVN